MLFASIDPDVADARGVPARALSFVFLVVLGVAVAAASQITGSLLVFALLVVPAATAQMMTARPVAGLCASVAVGLAITWLGLARASTRRTRSGSGSRRSRSADTWQPAWRGGWSGSRRERDHARVGDGHRAHRHPRAPVHAAAFVAGTAIAAASGLVGYFVVLRSQVFSTDALSHAAFTGALGALALGVDLRLGLFVVTAAVALGMGVLGPRAAPTTW